MKGFLKALISHPLAAIGSIIIVLFATVAVLAPVVAPYELNARVARPHEPPSWEHPMGSTRLGRDVLSQTIHATRTSVAIGLAAGLLVTVIGITVGVVAGYAGGKTDEVLNLLTNVVLVIPSLPLILVLAAFVGQAGPPVIVAIIGLTSWGWGARVVRAQVQSLRHRDFVTAAEIIGEPAWRIIFVELLPNLVSLIAFNLIGSILYAVITEATLSFLGLGDSLSISWGTMLYHAQATSALLVGAWWEIAAPALALIVFGSGLSLINFGVDEIANPKLRRTKLPASTGGTVDAAERGRG